MFSGSRLPWPPLAKTGSDTKHCGCREFARTMSRPFELTYDPYTQHVVIIDTPRPVHSACRRHRQACVHQTRRRRRPQSTQCRVERTAQAPRHLIRLRWLPNSP